MKNLYCILLGVTAILSTNYSIAQNSPPRNLQFDTLTLIATWEPPRRVLLDEHFEGAVFPPENWQDTTQGMGWFASTNGSSTELTIPPHTTYAVVNNDLAGAGNNRCCDNLVTPGMNLTQASAYTMEQEFPFGIEATSIYNSTGQRVSESNIRKQNSLSVNTESCPSGVYSMKFTNANGKSFIRTLVVVHQE
jgi:hypothetical protein